LAVNPKLSLPTCPPVALFRLIEHKLRNDPTMKRVVKTWRTWEGGPDDENPPAIASTPYIHLTPTAGDEKWWAASTLLGTLRIDIDIEVEGTCVDDMLNLWFALQRALYSADQAARLALQVKLQKGGAHSGLIAFNTPTFVGSGNKATMKATAAVSLEYRFDVNPTTPGF
jgi:hypothetical protein